MTSKKRTFRQRPAEGGLRSREQQALWGRVLTPSAEPTESWGEGHRQGNKPGWTQCDQLTSYITNVVSKTILLPYSVLNIEQLKNKLAS